MSESKTCATCKLVKDINSFKLETIYSGKARKPIKTRRNTCIRCRYNAANVRRRTPEGRRKKRLLSIQYRHSMSAEEYLEMVDKQENLCAICGNPPSSKALAVDHDHVTNKTRELLCASCNFGLGWFRDDTETMKKAIEYIEKHQNLDSSKPNRGIIIDWGSKTRPSSRVQSLETN